VQDVYEGKTIDEEAYRTQAKSFVHLHMNLDHITELDKFLLDSDNFKYVYKHFTLEDARSIKISRPQNLSFIVSHCARVMHTAATSSRVLEDKDLIKKCKGAIHILYRIFPAFHEMKDEATMQCLWQE